MKKIIELAQIFLSMCVKTWSYDKETGRELAQALEKRISLEQTPITEDWLKKHGFIYSDELHSKRDKIYIHAYGIKCYLDVIMDTDNIIVGNVDQFEITRASFNFSMNSYGTDKDITLADLYDAMELCGITID